ncbi:Uncharacterised protein [Chryseobacterium taklimakanense]|uniref:Uncharacterized protein n=1 Tax=Chryseobacterium taklimakanense TaxID=536441 RepID=A0A239XP79_9FLAO|nr:Uncharacterised protein [Chryseobacterium taklimakanense]
MIISYIKVKYAKYVKYTYIKYLRNKKSTWKPSGNL